MSLNTKEHSNKKTAALIAGSIGVVFGDIGTSPLYAMKEIFREHLTLDPTNILGVLSLIFWSLMLVVAIKYSIIIMRANNKGEGGVMALTALALLATKNSPHKKNIIVIMGILGATLFYGDSVITPAISVLSAVEGLKIIAPKLEYFVIPITLSVLLGLFIIQGHGTLRVGKLFAPVMILWFLTLACLGVLQIVQQPQVLMAINPYYAINLLSELGVKGFLIMGSVVLVMTGAEALYADMGHFGLKPIRYAWFGFIFPALLCNYFGQGALLLEHPEAIENPFYLLTPSWMLYPMLTLSTFATVIASQAVISGAFSITKQAMQLGYCPRMSITHTSDSEIGQIYMPTVNWMLMFSVFVLVLSFKSSSNLASAYGIAVTGTMMIDTILSFIVIHALWRWNPIVSYLFLGFFMIIDSIFLSSNSLKILSGGWLPLVVGGALFLLMTTWIKGRAILAEALDEKKMLFEELEEKLTIHDLVTVKGTAIYLARNLHGIPQVLLHNMEHNHVIHERIIVLTIVTTDEPYIDSENQQIKIRTFGSNKQFYRVKLYYGFKESPDIRYSLSLAVKKGLDLDMNKVSFFVGNEHINFKRKSKMPLWRRDIFLFLFHNSSNAIDFFRIPVEKVIELGVRVEL
ncbi:MAG: potassium transporter Kup [Methylococcaceae bacterium]|nr:potassium transporter Kup [Methylococcaceae bacterium]